MMKTGTPKPPVAPKPKLVQTQRPVSSSDVPKIGIAIQGKHGVKPPLAPKPKVPDTVRTMHQSTYHSRADLSVNVGQFNTRNGMCTEHKKPEWDYIIPICVCNQLSCSQCTPKENGDETTPNITGLETWHKGGREQPKKPVLRKRAKQDKEQRTISCNTHLTGNTGNQGDIVEPGVDDVDCLTHMSQVTNMQSSVSERLTVSLPGEGEGSNVKPLAKKRTVVVEESGRAKGLGSSDAVTSATVLIQTSSTKTALNSIEEKSSISSAPTKSHLVPMPRKPRKFPFSTQVARSTKETTGLTNTELSVATMENPSFSLTDATITESSSSCPEAPVSCQIRILVEHGQTEALCHKLALDAEKNMPSLSECVKKTKCSVREEEMQQSKCQMSLPQNLHEGLEPNSNIIDESGPKDLSKDKMSNEVPQQVQILSLHVSSEPSVMEVAGKEARRKNRDVDEGFPTSLEGQSGGKQNPKKISHVGNEVSNAINRPSNTQKKSVKPRAKSFSSADLCQPEVQRKNSFRKLWDLDLSLKRLPWLSSKGSPTLDRTAAETELSVDEDRAISGNHNEVHSEGAYGKRDSTSGRGAEQQCSCPSVGTEQSVDGEEFPPFEGNSGYYENLPIYEDIPDYVNISALNAERVVPPLPPQRGPEDENIYEQEDPYEEVVYSNTSHQHESPSYSDFEDFAEECVDAHSEDDANHSSDEEDGDSSASSKGEFEAHWGDQRDREVKKAKHVHIAKEIMSSEKVFVDVLKLLHIDFRNAVVRASSQAGKPVIEEDVLNQILYYLPQLYELNQDLLKELEDRVSHWDEKSRLADIFVKKGPYLKMYSTYIREFDKNAALLDEQCRRNPAFAGVVRDFESSPCCASLALKHYLLKPIQRIPQYQLLLTDYLKNLTEDSLDYADTQAALRIVKEVASHANDNIKKGDNFEKVLQIQCRLTGHHEIVQPGREFLKEGILMKLSRKIMQPRMFFLFTDCLLYTTPVQSGQFKLNNMLSLTGMKVSKPSQEGHQNELRIESVERSFILSASSASSRDEWFVAISTAISDYTRKKISFMSSKSHDEETESEASDSGATLGSKAPIWIPDLRTTMCMICTTEFTLTWRRHHCRACGRVVCHSCSTNKYPLEYLKHQTARVCDHCLVVLQQKESGGLQPNTPLSPTNKSPGNFPFRRQKKIPAALKEVSANADDSSMSGYLERSKGNRKQWKKFWFVIKDKVLYTYAASEDVAALESQPLLGFSLQEEKSGPTQRLIFKLFHKSTQFYNFKADDDQIYQRWIEAFKEAMTL